jgi:hypothetical protein
MDLFGPASAAPADRAIGPPIRARALLRALGFEPVTARFTDEQPGYRYDFGNWVLEASVLTSHYLSRVMQFSGVISGRDSISMVDFALPLELESYEQGVALIAFGLPHHFVPSIPTPWLEQGRGWGEHLPGEREMRIYRARPQCHVEAEWFRVAAKKLRLIAETSDSTKACAVSFQGGVLKFDLADIVIAMPATGNHWPSTYQVEVKHLVHISKRTHSDGVHLGVWQKKLTIGNRLIPLGTDDS